jgi:putative sterol carrier protein
MEEEMVEAIFDGLAGSFRPGSMKQTLNYYYSVGEVRKTVILGPEVCRVENGKSVENADCVCKTSPDFFLKIWNEGYTPGMKDFLAGTIKSNNPSALKDFLAAFGKQG